ncbi:hypothetical protein HDU89_005788 [Geranomyces variabilis]|nr:hypothetical protein HDU89_005788 [Geranomyces variabilis]
MYASSRHHDDDSLPLREVPKQSKFRMRPVLPVTQLSNGALKGAKAVSGVAKDFQEFLNRGNVVDLYVLPFVLLAWVLVSPFGIVMGAAFTSIVTSFITDLISPLISLATRANLSNNFLVLRCPKNNGTNTYPPRANCAEKWAVTADAQKEGAVTFNWGSFLQVCFNFMVISIIVFFIVKMYSAAFRRGKAEVKTKECTFCCSDIKLAAVRCSFCCKDVPDEKEPEPIMPEPMVSGPGWKRKKSGGI